MAYRYSDIDIPMSHWGEPWMSKRRRGLRTWVLVTLQRSPKTGAEIMDEMERMSAGWWRPSPGSVYPLLEELVQEGVARRREDGRYELAGPARDRSAWPFPAWGPRSAEDAARDLSSLVSYLEDLQRSDTKGFQAARDAIRGIADRLDRLVR